MIELRSYQAECVDALFRYFERADGHPLVEMPTASGKSLTMAAFVKDAIDRYPDTRVLLATHRKELIEQDAAAIRKLWPDAPVGIYSAGLHSRQVRRITVAGVQTVHKKAAELGHVSLLLVDEAHLLPFAGEGMYRRLIRDLTETNPALKIVGFTATPYRLSGGLLTRGTGHIFTSIAYKIPVQRLVDEGWLSPLVSPSTSTTYNTEGVGTVNGDFAVGELQSSVDKQEAVTRAALAESLELAKGRRAGIVFCVSVQHALLATSILRERGETCAMITGDTDDLTRASSLSRFKRGEVRWLVGVDVLTTGFDAPITDVIVLLRPTQSAGLYVQVCGRGMRLYDGKADCLVLDYGGNVERHGPITNIRHKSLAAGESKMVKECSNCMAEVKISKRECPECGFIFPEQPRDIDHDKTASRKAIMGPAPEPVWVEIDDVRASEWVKRAKEGEAPKPPTVCVEYLRGGRAVVKEWLCPEHGGYAAQKFCRWWFDAGGDLPAPHTVALALERIDAGELKRIEAVQVGKDGQYDRVLARRFGDVVKAEATTEPVEDFGEIPF